MITQEVNRMRDDSERDLKEEMQKDIREVENKVVYLFEDEMIRNHTKR